MRTAAEQRAIREHAFRWLEEEFIGRGGYEIHRNVLSSYTYEGQRIPLLDQGRGIRNPADFSATLSIMSGWKSNQYQDYESDDGWVTYSYRAGEGGDNVKLVRACEQRDPIIYFRAVREGYYVPYFPIVIAENDPVARVVRFPLDQGLALLGDPAAYSEDQRSYAETIVKVRLHQPVFRARVLHAYQGACTVCDLRHSELLDAAHIAPDASQKGVAHVTNGLAMCKIHHAAYDRALMGITPDFEVRVNAQLLDEVDGPMLQHGLQEMHGRPIRLPKNRSMRPARDLLANQFELFQKR